MNIKTFKVTLKFYPMYVHIYCLDSPVLRKFFKLKSMATRVFPPIKIAASHVSPGREKSVRRDRSFVPRSFAAANKVSVIPRFFIFMMPR